MDGRQGSLGLLVALAACAGQARDTDARVWPSSERPCLTFRAIEAVSDPPSTELDRPIRFGGVDAVGGVGSATLVVENGCGGELELRSVRIGGDSPPGTFGVEPFDPAALAGGQPRVIDLSFDPSAVEAFEDRLILETNDPVRPHVEVRLEGAGLGGRLELSPGVLDLGTRQIGCERSKAVVLRNVGTENVVIDRVQLFTTATDEFSVDINRIHNGSLPFTLSPADGIQPEITIYLDHLPLDELLDRARVSVYSNDPFHPELSLEAVATGERFASRTESFVQGEAPAIDILFTVDRSSSMTDNHSGVIDNFGAFVRRLSASDTDYHVAAVVADDGCVVGPDAFIDPSFSLSDAERAFEIMVDRVAALAPYGSNSERGFMLAESALYRPSLEPEGCNSGFYRDDAYLSVVHISDEPDQSVNGWPYYVARLQSLKDEPDQVEINAIAGDYPTGCETANAGIGYYEATVATGGVYASICRTDWARSLEDIADKAIHLRDGFVLEGRPVSQTISVAVDGLELATGWSYHASNRSIRFERGAIPYAGAEIDVRFEQMPRCPRD